MSSTKGNTKRIAKNTIALYIRSIIVLLITLYTARVVLKALGVEDYGIYNVVGGVVTLISFLRTSLSQSTRRFLNVEMVKSNGNLKKIFQASLTIHIVIAIFAFIVAESLGLWFVNTCLNIPLGREFSANMVYQSALLSLLFMIISAPYSASIIAHEKMTFFAVVSIIDAFLKLGIAILISYSEWDRLIIYAFLMLGVQVLNFIMYMYYCSVNFDESRFGVYFDKNLMKKMLGYTSWNVLGQGSSLIGNHGNSILMNIFHTVTANAALGISNQVQSAVNTLIINFQTAFNPQITKSYASEDFKYLNYLVCLMSKISFYVMLIVALPIIFNIEYILQLWLGNVPKYTETFCILCLCDSFIYTLSMPLNNTILSSQNIKWYQIMISIIYLSEVVVLYVFFVLGYPAVTALYINLFAMIVSLFVKLHFAHLKVPTIKKTKHINNVFAPLILSSIIPIFIGLFIFQYVSGIVSRLFFSLVIMLISIILAYYVGLNYKERDSIRLLLKKRININ